MSEKRKRGSIKVKPGSDEAKRIEKTHGFGAAAAVATYAIGSWIGG